MEFRVEPAVISIAGRIPPTASHAHHALQLSVARQGSVLLDDVENTSVLIREDTPHRLSADDALTILIDPESHCAQLLRNQYLQTSSTCSGLPIAAHASMNALDVIAELVPEACFERHIDPRIADILSWFDEAQSADRWAEVTLAGALKRACLSESRFLHLFREHAGTAWRAALIWRRAHVAMELALRGKSLTEAAHLAGYADSAHLSRQFKRLFGLSPSVVAANSRFVQGK